MTKIFSTSDQSGVWRELDPHDSAVLIAYMESDLSALENALSVPGVSLDMNAEFKCNEDGFISEYTSGWFAFDFDNSDGLYHKSFELLAAAGQRLNAECAQYLLSKTYFQSILNNHLESGTLSKDDLFNMRFDGMSVATYSAANNFPIYVDLMAGMGQKVDWSTPVKPDGLHAMSFAEFYMTCPASVNPRAERTTLYAEIKKSNREILGGINYFQSVVALNPQIIDLLEYKDEQFNARECYFNSFTVSPEEINCDRFISITNIANANCYCFAAPFNMNGREVNVMDIVVEYINGGATIDQSNQLKKLIKDTFSRAACIPCSEANRDYIKTLMGHCNPMFEAVKADRENDFQLCLRSGIDPFEPFEFNGRMITIREWMIDNDLNTTIVANLTSMEAARNANQVLDEMGLFPSNLHKPSLLAKP